MNLKENKDGIIGGFGRRSERENYVIIIPQPF